MNNHLERVRRLALLSACAAAACSGLFGCSDNYDLDDEGNSPSWLGSSIYAALENPNQEVLTGQFSNYLRLVDDLGYAEVLGKTGSKTVFPANDEAFERFYRDNAWGVSRYEDLTEAMKKQLLYTSMLDNAILIEMLSNVSSGSSSDPIDRGIALKHTTTVNVIDSITQLHGRAEMPANNSHWDRYGSETMDIVCDATRPMMVHFTSEQMTANNITTLGEGSDFEIITGDAYTEGAAYVFRNKVVNADVTCQNGYIHQVEDVLVPPGNVAEVIRKSGESNYFSRMLDRFCAPYENSTVRTNYNDYARANGLAEKSNTVYEWRYFSERSKSKNAGVNKDPDGNTISDDQLLPFDPGWNEYTNAATGSDALSDLCAMFVPTDAAMERYFLPGGKGAFLIDQYGKLSNTRENLNQNIDSIPMNIVQAFLSNLMNGSFVSSVPSKFDNIMNDASDVMGLKIDSLNKNADGTYNVKIANNGVVYMLNTVFAPTKYEAVSAPALLSDNMRVMNWAIQDKSTLSQNFYAYLLAMTANYALFIPDDEAFGRFYIDPAYLGHEMTSAGEGPRALHFYYDTSRSPYLFCSEWSYDPTTNMVGDSLGLVGVANVKTQLVDILNYHTVVLNTGEKMGENRYYKTKHGGEIEVAGPVGNITTVRSGAQIDNGLEQSNVSQVYNQENGTTFRIDHVIQAPQNSVYKILSTTEDFRQFFNLCQSNSDVMSWAGISTTENTYGTTEQDKYNVFVSNKGLDYNVKFFNTYNYTVYVPNNAAMEKAYAAGLPTWDDLVALQNSMAEKEMMDENDPEVVAAKEKAKLMIEEINHFVRYHFQDNSIYVDNTIETGAFQSQCADTLGIYQKLTVGGGNGQIIVTDARGTSHTISSSNGTINKMARDYVFDAVATRATGISTSSFAVIHEIKEPLNYHETTDRFDGDWQSARSMKQALKRWERSMELFLQGKYK